MSPKTRTEKPRRTGKDKAWDTNCLEIKLRNNVGDTEGKQTERQSVLWGLMGNPLSGPQILTTTKKLFFSVPSKDGLHITLREVNV